MHLFTACRAELTEHSFFSSEAKCGESAKLQPEKRDRASDSLMRSILSGVLQPGVPGFSFNWLGCRYILALFFSVARLSLVWPMLMWRRWVFPGAGSCRVALKHRPSAPPPTTRVQLVLDAKPHRLDLGLPRRLCLFKLLALRQTGVSSLCQKFSLCAGGWLGPQKQLSFSWESCSSKEACDRLGPKDVFGQTTVQLQVKSKSKATQTSSIWDLTSLDYQKLWWGGINLHHLCSCRQSFVQVCQLRQVSAH